MAKSVLKIDLNNYSTPIDGLRAIAVIAVIINHFKEYLLPSGYLGVDVFFVISGFVISSSMINRKYEGSKKFFLGFYKRRIKRLFPALLLTFIVAGFGISFFAKHSIPYVKTGLLSLPGLSNFNLYFSSIDYWGESSKLNPFTHTWSLAVEEQFYFVFPFFVWLLLARNTNTVKGLARLSFVVGLLSIVSVFCFILFSENHPMAVYFLMPFRFWEIGLGCLIYSVLSNPENSFANKTLIKLKSVPIALSILLLLGTFFLPKSTSGITTLLVVVLTFILILQSKLKENDKTDFGIQFLVSKPMVYVGKISYSLYLWHWVVFTLFIWTLGLTWTNLPIILVAIIFTSTFSYYVVEMPLRKQSWRKNTKPKITFAFMFIPFFVFIGFLKFSSKNPFFLGKINEAKITYTDSLKAKSIEKKCNTIRVFGNSHAVQLRFMLGTIAEKHDINLIIDKKKEDYVLIPYGDNKHISKLEDELNKLHKNDILIISSRFHYLYEIPYLNGQGEVENQKSIKIEKGYGLEIWIKEMNKVLELTKEKGINLILILPNVEFDVNIPKGELCQEQWFRNIPSDCNVSVSRKYIDSRFPDEWYDYLHTKEKNNSHFYLFDPINVYCPNDGDCYLKVEGIKAFRDTHHLSKEGSYLMIEEFYEFLIENNLL
ncbi:MAG: acyltransferase [Flavobacteriales bacterium]|nr:acyltransferase [Flavobacteriales bacterium]